MEIKELLPIGSVVLLKEGKKKLMTFGVKQTDANTKKEYDYIGVLYPEGNIGDGGQFLFNHDAQGLISLMGKDTFIENLTKYYENQK